jgi:DNA polymerase-3 subunit epsilon
LNPERDVEAGALAVHGIDDEFLAVQPKFADIAAEFLAFVSGAELVIHNADFDVEFINHELRRLGGEPLGDIGARCKVLDTLAVARRMHPGQRNSLDALAKRYGVDNSKRELHGALLDAQILADVYLAMTGGQASLSLEGQAELTVSLRWEWQPVERAGLSLVVLAASTEERAAHEAMLERMRSQRRGPVLWDRAAYARGAT